MLPDLFEAAVRGFLARKQTISRDRAARTPKAPLPVLGKAGADGRVSKETIEAVNRQCGKMPYQQDPWFGIDDFYNHPETSQWRLNNEKWDIPYDCDDYATYAVALLRACGLAHSKAWLWNLLINPAHQLTDMAYNHVIAGVEYWDGTSIWTAVIDTNTAASGKLFWVKGSPDLEAVQAAVIQHFNAVYKKQYYKVLRVDYPF